MRAAFWWIDRWLASSAFLTMTLEEQGAYRNLIDQLWLRDGFLPDDETVLARGSGAGADWPRLRKNVLAHFVRVPGGYRNETHDRIQKESHRLAAKQRRYRANRGNVTGHVAGNVTSNVHGNNGGHVPRSLSPAEGDREGGAESASGLPGGPSGRPAPEPIQPRRMDPANGFPLRKPREVKS